MLGTCFRTCSTSKALVTSSVALVPSSFSFFGLFSRLGDFVWVWPVASGCFFCICFSAFLFLHFFWGLLCCYIFLFCSLLLLLCFAFGLFAFRILLVFHFSCGQNHSNVTWQLRRKVWNGKDAFHPSAPFVAGRVNLETLEFQRRATRR